MSAQLIGLSYSPWTEKARWALDHHQIPYRYHEHLILFGMPELRLRTGKWTGEVTVPALIVDGQVLGDSWDIARFADAKGASGKLFSDTELQRIEHYNQLSEKALDAARILYSARLLEDREAKAEALPAFVPGPMRSAMSWLANVGVSYIGREFGYSVADRERALETLKDCYRELKKDLEAAGGDHLVGGRFSYADVAMAATIQGLEPMEKGPVRLGPASRRCWGSSELKSEFQSLIDWRDRLYARHRAKSARIRE